MIYYLICTLIISYLIGSFSTAYWFSKWFHNINIREHGSKNAGATNVIRVLGYKAGIPVFIIDILKSFGPINLVYFIPEVTTQSETFYLIMIVLGSAAVLGHIFPVFSGFNGGKGVATLLGVVLAVHPLGALLSLLVFVTVFLITRIVSISSICAGLLFPLFIFVLEGGEKQTLLVFSVVASLLLIITHVKNIKRLLKGEEKRMVFKKE